LLEVGHESFNDFLISHIPGATYLDTQALEEGPYWNKVPDSELLRLLLALGVRHDTMVIIYGRNLAAAARAAHLLLYAGVSDVRFLDGGFKGWTRAGFPCISGMAPCGPPETDFGSPFPACPHYLMNLQQARTLLQKPGGALVSIRTWEEFTGKTSGYSYIPARGEIPGALWGHAGRGTDVNDMSDFHDSEKRIRSANEISDFWRKEGIRSDMQIGFYCGTGWRASLAFYCAWLMGWERISVFDGGWFEWSQCTPLE
jgi:thiosulfate/3-mercaptopyruvate sulfurtransferase